MEQRMLVITPEDKILSMPYQNNMSIQQAVEGYEESCGTQNVPVVAAIADGKEELEVNVYSNGSWVIMPDPKFDKINAVASLMTENEIRGNAVFVLNEGEGKERGFLYAQEEIDGTMADSPCECWTAMTTLKGFINRYRDIIRECHELFDGNKEESFTNFMNLKAVEMMIR